MKDKIFLFVIGVLVGAVIATGTFYIYTTTLSNSNNQSTQMNGGTPPEMPSGQNGQPPEKPDGSNNDNGQPPEKPSDNNTQNNSTQENSY